jgi:hypothetical protein
VAILCAAACLFAVGSALARPVWEFDRGSAGSAAQALSPAYQTTAHTVGRLYLPITNTGQIGSGHVRSTRDVFTGETITYCEFPRGSFTVYMSNAGLWVGALKNRDTLVSTSVDGVGWSREFHPDASPYGEIIYRSNLDPTSPRFDGAISEQDFICTYYDTCRNCPDMRNDAFDGRPHIPLDIEVTQRSYSWSYSYAQDIVLLDFEIKNIGNDRLTDIYVGFYADGDVSTTIPVSQSHWGGDDVCGFIEKQPAWYMKEPCPVDSDVVNLAWCADDDGDMDRPQEYVHVPHVTAAKIVRVPRDSLQVSFNWWATNRRNPQLDFGPQARVSYRDLGFGNLGTPWGDRNMYHFLRNGERDYDEVMIYRHGALDPDWVPPPLGWTDTLLTDLDSRYLLSFGPFGLDPGQSLPLTTAYIGGAHFHYRVGDASVLPDHPEQWYNIVNFDSLEVNATWADWIYDNPGVDTDSDGYAGDFTICNYGDDSTLVCDTTYDTSANPDTMVVSCYWAYDVVDTVWRTGDGVPDFQGASPPPNPSTYHFINQFGDTLRGLRVYPSKGNIHMVWNGVMSENTMDPFTHQFDFEGYKVYIARDDRPTSYSLAASYDRENYNIWEWTQAVEDFVIKTRPFSLQELRCLFADSCTDTTWYPEQFPRNHPLLIPGGSKKPDVILYFEPMGYNRSVFGNDPSTALTTIKKVYPDAPKPPVVDPDSIAYYFPDRDDPRYFTEDGFLKYYEYEYTFDNLLPTVSYWVNVTAFDYGFRELGLAGLETNPALMPVGTYALPSTEVIAEEDLEVFVYPNPYRKDAGYRRLGYEGRGELNMPDDYVRAIHFANLPPKCTIRIFSLDGDLIKEFYHDVDPGNHLSNHASWDLINKNNQLVVSGLYIWTVEDANGETQIGKLVVIM